MRQLFTLLSIFFISNIFSQTPVFWKFDEDNGLNTSNVYDLHLDKKGFLWLGTESGLLRFNGVNFQEFKAQNDKGNFKSYISEHENGTIWCENASGQLFYVEKQKLKILDLSRFGDFFITDYVIGPDNKVYIQDRLKTIFEIDIVANKVSDLKRKLSLNDKNGFLISFDLINDKLYIIESYPTHFRLWVYSGGKFRLLDKYILDEEYNMYLFFKVQNYNGKIHITNKHGNDFFIYNNGKIQKIEFSPPIKSENKINRISIDNNNNYLISTTYGAYIYQLRNDTLHLQNALFSNTNITDFIQDQYNRYWISTYSQGVYLTPNINLTLENQLYEEFKLSNATCMASYQDKLLFGMTNGSVLQFDFVNRPLEYKNRLQREIQQFFVDTSENILYFSSMAYKLGYPDKPLSRPMDLHPGSTKKFDKIGNQLLIATGVNIQILNFQDSVKTPSGRVWNGKDQTVENIYGRTAYVLRLGDTRTRTLLYDKANKNLWVAFSGGLCYFDKDGIKHNLKYNDVELYVYSMVQDENGLIWIGTGDRGIFAIDVNKIVKNFDKSNGLVDNFCKGIYRKGKNLYISTDKGLNILNTETYQTKIYNKSNGLISNNIVDIAFTQNKVWILTTKGLVSIAEGTEDEIPVIIPSFYVTGVQINEVDTLVQDFYDLRYNQNSITVKLSGTYLNYLESFTYKYKLKGFDDKWYEQSSLNPFIRFPAIPPGNYELEIFAETKEGIRSPQYYKMQFNIAFPFWKSWWFILLSFFLGIIIISSAFNQRIKSLERRNALELEKSKIEQELRSSQLASLKVQMNPHFIFNALNSIQDFIMSNDKKQANTFLSKFARLMRKTLDLSNERTISLSDELDVIQLYLELEAVRFEENFSFSINIQPNIDTSQIYIPSMLIQPFVENAIKHGLLHKKGEKKLEINFKLSKDESALICEIIDNGIGIKRSKLLNSANKLNHKSFSTGATQKRLELLNMGRSNIIALEYQDLQDENLNESAGTKVTLEIPFNEF